MTDEQATPKFSVKYALICPSEYFGVWVFSAVIRHTLKYNHYIFF